MSRQQRERSARARQHARDEPDTGAPLVPDAHCSGARLMLNMRCAGARLRGRARGARGRVRRTLSKPASSA